MKQVLTSLAVITALTFSSCIKVAIDDSITNSGT